MAGNANSGRRRTPIPTGKEAEEELRRIRRQERRRERAARKRAEANGEEYVPPAAEDEVAAGDIPDNLAPPSTEELKADLMFAFHALGGKANLVAWGRRYPKEFYQLWARYCLPKEDEGPKESGSLESLLAQLDQRKETVQ